MPGTALIRSSASGSRRIAAATRRHSARTFNGVSPQPISEGSADGKVSFTLGHIPQGKHYTLFVSLQVNPTNVGHHGQTVWLYDGSTELVAIHHEITIWP